MRWLIAGFFYAQIGLGVAAGMQTLPQYRDMFETTAMYYAVGLMWPGVVAELLVRNMG